MASEPTNPLYEFETQKAEVKQEPSANPLYDLDTQNDMKGESNDLLGDFITDTKAANGHVDLNEVEETNGHAEDVVANGDFEENEGENEEEPVAVTQAEQVEVPEAVETVEEKEEEEPEEEQVEEEAQEGDIAQEKAEANETVEDQNEGPAQNGAEVDKAEVGKDLKESALQEGTTEENVARDEPQLQVEEDDQFDNAEDDTFAAESQEKAPENEQVETLPEMSDVHEAPEEMEQSQEVVEEPFEEAKQDSVQEVEPDTDQSAGGTTESTGEDPAPEEPVQTEMAQEEPYQNEAVEEDTAQVEATQEEPDQAEAVKEGPAQTEVVEEEPAQTEVVEDEPQQIEAAQDEPVQAEPVQEQTDESQPDVQEVTQEPESDIPEESVQQSDEAEQVEETVPEPVQEPEQELEPEQQIETPAESQVELEKEDEYIEEPSQGVEKYEPALEQEQTPEQDVTEAVEQEVEEIGEAETKPAEPVAEPEPKEVQQAEENAAKFNGNSEPKENGLTEEEMVHFAEMNNVRTMFESGKAPPREEEPQKKTSIKDEYDAGGEYESTPVANPDVVKESDHASESLPEAGMAKNLLSKFKSIQEEKAAPVASGRRASPPKEVGKVEYSNEPSERIEQYQGKSDEGVFESNPQAHEDVVRSGDYVDDVVPEKGSAKNILNKFKEIQSGAGQQVVKEPKREITPDRSGKVEYVSEPRGQNIVYDEYKGDQGVFESTPTYEEGVVRCGEAPEEVLPESGMAKSLLSKFKQMESEVKNRPPPSPKREITPDRSGKVEYVSEPRGFLEKYEPQTESGVYENQPAADREVVRCGEAAEEILPESGSAKKTLEKFKEIQKQSSSPVSPSGRSKAFTPPREASPGRTVAGVVENTPGTHQDVVRSGDIVEDQLPEQGSAKNILNKFKEIQSGSSSPSSPSRKPKEFTPPPESGVYENKPDEHIVIESSQTFSGVLESTPSKSTADVPVNRDQQTPENEIPESGMAKNLVSKFRQLETSAKTSKSVSPKFKEFTPPRDSRGPLSPKSPAGAATNGVHPSDLPGQYQQQNSATIYENEPEKREGVYREADTDWEEGLPAPNTTMSMLQRFRSIQQKAEEDKKTPAPISKKDDTSQSPSQQDHEAKGMFKVVQTEKCAACQKTVYAMERLEMNGDIYHRNCFKCSHCSARLTPKTFSMNEGVIFCTTHFKQLFARKGNYDEGFGRQQYKKKWGDKTEGTSA